MSQTAFRLANYIIEKEEFGDIVKAGWTKSCDGHDIVEDLKGKLSKIDKDPLNKKLREDEVKILDEYTIAAQDEENLLCQRAKVDWLKNGDKNSSYFHKVLKGKLKRSKIHRVLDNDDVPHEKDQVGVQFVNHFEKFHGATSDGVKMDRDEASLFNKIDAGEAECMSKEVTEAEIKKALFDIEDNKAPGPNGRAITDNILLTQELLRGYNSKNDPKRCYLKIDIQKAYDTVSWSFLEEILHNYGFPESTIKWIMVCISTPKFTVCVNGERLGYFKGGRGLRQGDPISPYLFTLLMEVLNIFIKDEIAKERNFKYHYGCKKLKINHLCFADDLLMLCHGDSISISTIKRGLEKFSKVSGLHPNMNKITMFCSSLSEEEKEVFLNILPFKIGRLLVRYLGVPMMDKKIRVKDCKSLVDKVRQKLCDWKNKSLSYAGRNQLIASVLSPMQVYLGSVFLIPTTVIKEIETLFKGFLWCNGDLTRGKASVAWKDVCKPKYQGGLGLKPLNLWNKTLLIKHLWNIAANKESLWVKWINTVKLKGRNKRWKWPNEWMNTHSFLLNIPIPTLVDEPDRALWVTNQGNMVKFRTKQVGTDIRGDGDKVKWDKLIWF
ncbi:RNA-directed DNA polymerase, eukaryota, reverse transcriptase zinc-binding domain protein [Tanacetum coccineum]